MTSLSPVRPVERVTPILTLLLVFLSGAVGGAVVMSLAGHSLLHGLNTTVVSPSSMSMSVGQWKQKLDLSDDQEKQLKSILDDFSTYYDNLLSDGNTRILQILNDSQKKKFSQMMQERKQK